MRRMQAPPHGNDFFLNMLHTHAAHVTEIACSVSDDQADALHI